MLELSLTGTVPTSRVDQVLGILAGHSASQPIRLQEHHVLFKPKPAVEKPIYLGASQDIQTRPQRVGQNQPSSTRQDALIVRLTRAVGEDEWFEADGEGFEDDDGPDGVDFLLGGQLESTIETTTIETTTTATATATSETTAFGGAGVNQSRMLQQRQEQRQRWTMSIYDLPQASPKNITSRSVRISKGMGGDMAAYLEKLEYSFLHHFLLSGHFVVIKNLVVRVFRVYKLPTATSAAAALDPAFFSPLLTSSSSSSSSSLPTLLLERLQPLDPSGAHLVEVTVRVTDGTKPDQVTRGIKELEEFKKRVQGVVDLVAPDRLAMDTRVRPH